MPIKVDKVLVDFEPYTETNNIVTRKCYRCKQVKDIDCFKHCIYFNRCDKCNPVKNIQKILLDKCDVLHSFKNQVVGYYGCDKCCKLRNLFDDYILPFTKLNKYPEYDEVHEIMRNDVQKKAYTL